MQAEKTSFRSLFTKELIAILFVSAAGIFSQEFLAPLLSLYMRDAGLSNQNIGLLFSVMMVGVALSELFWGWALDRVKLKIVLILGVAAYGAVTLALLVPKSLPQFLVVIFLYGFSRSPIFIVGRWYMGIHAPLDVIALAFGFIEMMVFIPSSLAGFSSGFFVEAWGFRNAILFSAAIPILVGVLLIASGRWLTFKQPVLEELEDPDAPETNGNGDSLRMTFFIGIFGVMIFVGRGVLQAYLPLYASDVAHLDPSQIGILFGISSVLLAVTIMPLGKLADKVGKPLFVPLSMGILALSMFMVAISHNFSLLAISLLLFAGSNAMYFSSVSALLAENVPVVFVGTAMGIYGLLEDLGWMAGPAVGGLLLSTWDIHSPFLFSAAFSSFGIPLFLWGRRWMPKRVNMSLWPKHRLGEEVMHG